MPRAASQNMALASTIPDTDGRLLGAGRSAEAGRRLGEFPQRLEPARFNCTYGAA
jgi:hypothetical protein